MLRALHLLARDGRVLLAHHTGASCASTWEAQDALESALAAAVRPYLAAVGDADIALAATGVPAVVMRAVSGVVFVASGADELALAEALAFLVRLVAATCDDALSPAQAVASHGKIVVCLDEAFRGGRQVHSDVVAVLRAAKLKAIAT